MRSMLDRPPVSDAVATQSFASASKPDSGTSPLPQPWMPLRVAVPVTIVVGYGALLLTGFGTSLGAWRPVPVYVFLGFLLFWLQTSILPKRTALSLGYVALATGFALFVAGDAVFNTAQGWHLMKDIHTYLAINAFMYVVFFIDVIRNRRAIARQSAASAAPSARTPLLTFAMLATDLVGLALVAILATGLAAIVQLGSHPYFTLDMNKTLGVDLPASIRNVQDLNFVIALGAATLALLVLAMISSIASLSGQADRARTGPSDEQPAGNVRHALKLIATTALDEISLTIRWALSPVIWILGTLSAAQLTTQITQYLQSSSPSTRVVDLFNPFSAHSVTRYGQGIECILLALVAVGAAIITVTLIEHRVVIIRQALASLRKGGQAIVLSLAFFTISLAALNALAVYVNITSVEPFQVSAVTLVALMISGVLALDSARRERHAQQILNASKKK
jgi:hypothetical protein